MPLIFLIPFLAQVAQLSPAQPFRPVTHGVYPAGYYAEQAERWSDRARSECGADEDWLHYFLYARYANRFDATDYDLTKLTSTAAANTDPDGFAINYIRYMQADFATRYDYLRRAYAADSLNAYAQSSMLTYARLTGDEELADRTSDRLLRYLPYPTGIMDYAYNTLQSVAPDGILLTFGDADTYPAWVLQEQFGVRTDVLVVNYYLLLRFPDYAARTGELLAVPVNSVREGEALIRALRRSDRPLHLAATAGNILAEVRSTVPEEVYPVGLTFQLSDTAVNNGTLNAQLYRAAWRLDHLRRPLADDPAARAGAEFEPNYLIPLLGLDSQSHPEVRGLIRTIAGRHGLIDRVNSILEDELNRPMLASPEAGVSAREIRSRYRNGDTPRNRRARRTPSHEPLPYYVDQTEVSNADYQLFLEDLLRQRKFDYLDTAAISATDWTSLVPDSIANLPAAELYAAGKPDDPDHPVVNISHRAAELYAIWLTQVYNQDPNRDEGRNVRFRLPTATEFALAARGGKKYAPYPWGGPYLYNSKGCILANLDVTRMGDTYPAGDFTGVAAGRKRSGRPDFDCQLDGAPLTASVTAYYPNPFGLYNMSGNVAEMTDVNGQTMGGSWLDDPEPLRIGLITERSLPSPSTGFRLIMEYTDE